MKSLGQALVEAGVETPEMELGRRAREALEANPKDYAAAAFALVNALGIAPAARLMIGEDVVAQAALPPPP